MESGGMHNGMNHTSTSGSVDPGGNDPHAGHNMNSNDTCNVMMMMYFHTGICEYVLFEALKTTNSGGMVGACFAIFFVAMFYEGLKVLREYLLQRSMVHKYAAQQEFNGSPAGDTKVLGTQNPGAHCERAKPHKELPSEKRAGGIGVHMISAGHFIQTLLHMLQVFISYCLMLVFMTYNAWLCIAVVVGAGVGYFLFGWRKAIVVDINEHCH